MSEKHICVHCGADCGKNPVWHNNEPFCCNGCKTVYQLLGENKLYTYYEIENTPGIKVDVHEFGKKYAYLDNVDIVDKLLDFQEDGVARVNLYIPSIHCSSCIWLLENLQKIHKGIIQSQVNFVKKRVSISYREQEISLRQLVELLASIHYVPQISLEDISKKSADVSIRKLIYKIGIAGFAFGNTMLLSFPEYLPGNQQISEEFRQFFGVLNFILALPVLFYSATDYLASGLKNLWHKVINIDLPISIGIIAIFLQSSYEIFSGSGTGYMDSLTGLVFFLLIGKWYQARSYKALSFDRDYKSYFPIAVSKLTSDGEKSIPLEEIKIGDKLLIRNHELIPADAGLLSSEAHIDYSFVTGESQPVDKMLGDKLFAGGKQIGQNIEIEVLKEVKQSRLTQVWNQEYKKVQEKKMSDIMDNVARYFTVTVLSIAMITAIYWLFVDSSKAIFSFTSVLIVACPCALSLSIPFAFGNTMRIWGKLGFFLKNQDVVDDLHRIDTLVFDKTGTVTQSDDANIEIYGQLSEQDKAIVWSMSGNSTHPASKIIHNHLNSDKKIQFEQFTEIAGKGIQASLNADVYKLGSSLFALNQKQTLENKATEVYFSKNDKLLAKFTLKNKYREGLANLIQNLSKKFDIHFISGDNESERVRLENLIAKKENIHFNQSPKEKLDYIKKLRNQGRHVCMFGDGLNDAGALLESNVGITIADDVYSFTPASDAILQAEKFNELDKFLDFSKIAVKIVRSSYIISFLYNLVGIGFAIKGLLSPIVAAILMPASSVTVVAFVSFATILFAKRRLSGKKIEN